MKTETSLNEKQGHWILAKLGKKVLRPGGRVLSEWLVKNLEITSKDDIVEFAPGLGFTANIACSYKPFSYTGVDKVYGEAMLTMHPLEHKKAIIAEAFRILKPGGYYAIHELGLQPDNVSDEVKNDVFKELSANIRVHARPMTPSEWKALFEEQGFKVVKEQHNAMLLLENKRVWQDEGIFRTLKFFFNLFTHPDLRKRVMNMKKTFRKHQKNLDAIALVVQKPL